MKLIRLMRRSQCACVAVAVLCFVAGSGVVTGAEPTAASDVEEFNVYNRLSQLESEVEAIKRSQFEATTAGVLPASAGVLPPAPEAQSTSYLEQNPSCPRCPPGYELLPADKLFDAKKYPTVGVTGFFHVEAGWFGQDTNNKATVGNIQDGSGFRRARIAAKGNVSENTSYILEFDFAQSQALFVDTWMNFAKVPYLGNIRIGRWRQPFGMSALTGVRELPFLERPLPFAFSPFRQTGIGFFDHSTDERMTWALSGYRFPSNTFGNNAGDPGGYGLAGRFTMLPYYVDEGEQLLHLGAAYSFNDPANVGASNLNSLQYQTQPEFFVGESAGTSPASPNVDSMVPPFVNTGAIPTRNVNLFGLEAAAALGRLYLQSEFQWASVRLLDGTTETLPGAYLQARYVLTGEKLPYNKAGGVFGRIIPYENFNFCGGPGAWELAGRWSYIDLNGSGFPGPGRRLYDLTFGVNWYLNAFTKFQFNYIHAFLKDAVLGRSDADIAAVRAQVDF